MKWLLVKDGVVKNSIVADQTFIDGIKDNYDHVEEVKDDFYAGPGFTWDGENYLFGEVKQLEPIIALVEELKLIREKIILTKDPKISKPLQDNLSAAIVAIDNAIKV